MNEPNFYTLDEAAEKLGVNREYLRKRIAKGEIKGYKRFSKWFVLHSDLLAYLQTGTVSTDKE